MKKSSVVAILSVLAATPAFAAFHLWDDRELFSTADGRVQFIELFDPSNGEEFLGGQTLRAISADTTQTNDFIFPSNTGSPTGGKSLLLATPGFATLPGGIAPDYTIPAGFLFPDGGSIQILFGTASETYGPGALPLNGRDSLNTPGQSTNLATPKNFAGTSAVITVPGPGSQRVYYDGLYHNNTNLDATTEAIPHPDYATNTFLEVHGESDHVDFYYLTKSPAGDGSVSTRVRIYALGPHGNAEYFAKGTFQANITINSTNLFHGTPTDTNSVVTLDLWRARWLPPNRFTGTGFYAPSIIISNGGSQTDQRFMVAKVGAGTNFGDNAYFWETNSQVVGTDYFGIDYAFAWTNPVVPNMDYYYYNNPGTGTPESENVPGLGGTKFFEYSFDPATPSYVYILAPQNKTTFLQTRFYFVNGGDEVYFQGGFYTNVVISDTNQFHGQPASGAVTLEVWRTAFHPPSGWTNNSVYYAPQAHTDQGQFFMVTGLDGSDTNELGVTNSFVLPQHLYTGGPFGRDWGFAPTGAVLPQVTRDYLYHNNTALNPQTELVPNNNKAFLVPNYETTTTTFYVITDRPANAVPGQNLIVQIRIDYNNPEYGYSAQYYNMAFDQNLYLTSSPGFHGLPVSGVHTADLWRFDWPQPRSTNSPFLPFTNAFTVYYAPFIKTTVNALSGPFQTDYTFLLANNALPANNYPSDPQHYGGDPFSNDYSYNHLFAQVDADGDGIPDVWELLNFGTTTNGAAGDNDEDNLSNLGEYIADTQPTNAASFFGVVTNFTRTASVLNLVVDPSSTARVYDAYVKTNLVAGDGWLPYGLSVPGNGTSLQLTVTNTLDNANYRTGVHLP